MASGPNGNGYNGNANGNGNGHPRWSVRRLRRWGRRTNHRRRRRYWGYRNGVDHSARTVALSTMLGLLLLVGLALTASTAYAGYNFVSFYLPSADLSSYQPHQTVRIYDRHGKLLYEFWDDQLGRRTVGKLSDFSPYLIAATLAAEDPTYFENAGVDVRSVLRAMVQNTTEGEIVSGASTVTMQLVRNVLFNEEDRTEQSLTRKAREALLAYRLTEKYTKDELLEMYLNEVYYGHLAYGVEAASRTYFNKTAAELTLAEAAVIAGLPQAPAVYDPFQNPEAAKERQLYVLNSLARHGFVSEDRIEAAKNEPLNYQAPQNELLAPHFTLYVKEYVERVFGAEQMYEQGFHIYTTLDYNLLKIAEEEARKHLAELTAQEKNATDASVVSIDPRTGEVLVMLGSPDYNNAEIAGEVNMAIAQRQPGSTLKPFTYLTAFEQNKMTPVTMIPDQPTQFPGGRGQPAYEPLNHDKEWHGSVTVRRALSGSLNVPAVLTLHWVGLENMLNTIHRMGIQSLPYDPDRIGLAVTLGGGEVNLLELTFAYTPFANQGRLVGQQLPQRDRREGFADLQPAIIKKIVSSAGETVFEYQPPDGPQVTRPEFAYQITSILSDDWARQATYGLNSPLKLSRPSAAKTGTTENYNDGWTIGYVPQLVTGVWTGNANNEPMADVFGSSGAGVIWHNFMERAFEYLQLPVEEFPKPDSLGAYRVMASDPMNSQYIITNDVFIPGTEPPGAQRVMTVTNWLHPHEGGTQQVGGGNGQPPVQTTGCVPGWIVRVNGTPARAPDIEKLYRHEVFNPCRGAPTPTPAPNRALNENPIAQATPVGQPAAGPTVPAGTLPETQTGPLPTVAPGAPPAGPIPTVAGGQSAPPAQPTAAPPQPAAPPVQPTVAPPPPAAPPVQPTAAPPPVQPTAAPPPPALPTLAPPIPTLPAASG